MKGKKSLPCCSEKNPHVHGVHFWGIKIFNNVIVFVLVFSILFNFAYKKKMKMKRHANIKITILIEYIYFSCTLMLNMYFRSTSVTKRVQRWNIWIPLFVYLSLL